MVGSPPSRSPRHAGQLASPFNRWGFQHVRDLDPDDPHPLGEGPVWKLPRAERPLAKARLRVGPRRTISLTTLLDETYTDAFLVLHRGRATEEYRNGMHPDTTHLLMSVSKSVTSTAAWTRPARAGSTRTTS